MSKKLDINAIAAIGVSVAVLSIVGLFVFLIVLASDGDMVARMILGFFALVFLVGLSFFGSAYFNGKMMERAVMVNHRQDMEVKAHDAQLHLTRQAIQGEKLHEAQIKALNQLFVAQKRLPAVGQTTIIDQPVYDENDDLLSNLI